MSKEPGRSVEKEGGERREGKGEREGRKMFGGWGVVKISEAFVQLLAHPSCFCHCRDRSLGFNGFSPLPSHKLHPNHRAQQPLGLPPSRPALLHTELAFL